MRPRRTDYRYLCGWYLVAYKGDTKRARQRAREHHKLVNGDKHDG